MAHNQLQHYIFLQSTVVLVQPDGYCDRPRHKPPPEPVETAVEIGADVDPTLHLAVSIK